MQKLPDVKSLGDKGYEIPPVSDIPLSLLVGVFLGWMLVCP